MNEHCIILNDRALLHATGVNSTESFGSEKIILHTKCGDLSVTGSDLTVEQLDMEQGEFDVHGRIDAIKYLSDKRHIPDNLFGRLFR